MAEYGEHLTEREKELMQLVATGVTNRQVAQQLSISVNTVKVHLRNIYAKLGAESRTEATMIAVREGWVTVSSAGEAPRDASGGITAGQPQVPPVVLGPPLPLFKRVALIAALPLVVAMVTVTRPRNIPRADTAPGLPSVQMSEQSPSPMEESKEFPWHEQAQMPTRRAYLALAVVRGHLFAIAGQTLEGTTSSVEIYDPESDIWIRGSDKPTPATYVSAAAIGADVYVPGGCDAQGRPMQEVEVYDTSADSWRTVRPLPEPRCAYALATLNEILFLFGGWDGERYVATVYIYNPQTDTWTEGTSMGTERGFAAATSLSGRIYVVGGHDGDRELTTCTAYDPSTETWEECAPLTVGRGELGLVNLGGQLYAIGGGGWTSYLGFNERYNPNNDAWSTIETPLVGEWRSPGVAAFDTSIYAIGGWSGDYLSLNQAYDPFPFRVFIHISRQD
ncbi:MAG: kelch repeat-containing protein [Chloroflexota bacterium]|nr:kelch repeat-containing protein [Chloroflexota bacterium]